MATFTVTTANWNDASFWSSINLSGTGNTLDFSALHLEYEVYFDAETGEITLTLGATTFTIGDAAATNGPYDANLGGSTLLEYFDTVIGGQGYNEISPNLGDDVIYGGDSDDDLYGGWNDDGSDTIFAGAGDDYATGGGGNDQISGEEGNDYLAGGTGDDELNGGQGNDRLVGERGSDQIYGGTGNDVLQGGEGADKLSGGDGADEIYGYSGDDVDGGEGGTDNDTLFVHDVDHIDYTTAEDGVVYFTDGTSLDFFNIETVTTLSSDGIVSGTAGADWIDVFYHDSDGDWVDGWDAQSSLGLTGDEDIIDAGAGNDSIWGSEGNDTIYGGAGDDHIESWRGNDELWGGTGNDYFIIGGDAHKAVGGDDADTFEAYNTQLVEGGSGGVDNDTLIVNDVDHVEISGADSNGNGWNGVVILNSGDEVKFSEIENFTLDGASWSPPGDVDGTAGDDVMNPGYTDADGDEIDGSDGNNDTIRAGAGNDTINAGDGEDVIYGGTGDDVIDTGDATIQAGSPGTAAPSDLVGGWYFEDDAQPADDFATLDNDGDLRNGAAVAPGSGAATFDGVDDVMVMQDDPAYHLDAATMKIGFNLDTLSAQTGLFSKDATGLGDGDLTALVETDGTLLIRWQDASTSYYLQTAAGTISTGIDYEVLVNLDNATGQFELYLDGTLEDSSTVAGISLANNTQAWTVGGLGWKWARDTDSYVTEHMDGTVYAFEVFDGAYSPTETEALFQGTDTVYGEEGNDTITGGAGDDLIYGGAGNDTITGGTGNDTVYGGDGNDTYTSTAGDGVDTVYLESGDDTFITVGGPDSDTAFGGETGETNGDTFVVASTADNTDTLVNSDGSGKIIIGGVEQYFEDFEIFDFQADTDDRFNGTADTEGLTVYGHGGNDSIDSGSGDDVVDGGAGNDSIGTGGGNDVLIGGAGDDTMKGMDGDDTFTFEDGFGNDQLTGGEGGETNGDTLDFSAVTEDLTLNLDAGSPNDPEQGSVQDSDGSIGETVTFSEIENINLGSGNDTILGSSGGENVDGGAGDDTFTGGGGGDTLTGGSGDDTFNGIGVGDHIDGSETGETAGDTLDLTNAAPSGGSITVTYDAANPENGTVEFFDAGGASLGTATFANIENVVGAPASLDYIVEGTAGDDTIDTAYTGDPEGDMVDAGDNAAGNDDDVIQAGAGSDTVDAGLGNDTVYGDAGADTIHGGDGNDEIHGGDASDLLHGDAGDDTVYGDAGNESVYGDAGNDTLFGGAGQDTVWGGDGNDTIHGDDDNDFLYGNLGNDVIYGDAGDDLIRGNEGDDTIYGGAGDDDLNGDDGDDTFIVEDNWGQDGITGGETGETTGDTIDASAVTADTTLDFSTYYSADPEKGTLSDGTNLTKFQDIENVQLGSGDDTIISADGGGATVDGGAGNDTFNGPFDSTGDTAAANAYTGGAGDDTFNGIGVGDHIDGSETGETAGDTLDLTNAAPSGGSITVTYDAANPENGTVEFFDAGGTSLGTATFANIENVVGAPASLNYIVEGTAGDDVIDAAYTGDPEGDMVDNNDGDPSATNPDDDRIEAGAGNDIVHGGLADDDIYGEGGNDTLFGDTGNDHLYGGDGNDVINTGTWSGSGGAEYSSGGGGDDTVILEDNWGSESAWGGETNETAGDTLDASAVTNDLTLDLTQYGNDGESGYLSDGAGNSAKLGEFEHMVLGSGDDTITGSVDGGEDIDGGAGNDTFDGNAGGSTLTGGAGDDTFNTIAIGDHIDGSETGETAGDTLDLTNAAPSGGSITVTYDAANPENGTVEFFDAGGASLGTATFANIENVVGAPASLNYIVEGTAGDDTIDTAYTGDPEGDMVDANDNAAGNNDDVIQAGAGNDQVSAGLGNDTIYAGDGNDSVDGGDGNDAIYTGQGVDASEGGSGDDTVFLEDNWANGTSDEKHDGSETGETNGDTLDASAVTTDVTVDFDALGAGDPESGIISDAGNGARFVSFENVVLGSGDDTILGSAGGENVDGGAGDDTFTGGGGGDTLTGGSGDDTFNGIGVGDHIDGSETGETAGDTLDLTNAAPSGGSITVTYDAANPENGTVEFFDAGGTSLGTATFANIENVVGAPAGLDYIVEGTAGDDVIDAAYTGDPEGDMVDNNDNAAGNNDDVIQAGDGNDTVNAGNGNDTIYGGAGDDDLFGADGDDVFIVEDGWGDDGLVGDETGETNGDTADLTAVTTDVTVDFTAGGSTDPETGYATDGVNQLKFSEIENVNLGSGDDTIIGSVGGENVDGGAGNDTFTGGGGGDTLTGGSGDDTFVLEDNFGNDTIVGGEAGETNGDHLDASAVTADTVLDLTAGPTLDPESGTLSNGTQTVTFSEIENITLGSGNDTILGSGGDDTVDAGEGDDTLDGGAGNDTFTGGQGNDTIIFEDGDGDDTITDFDFTDTDANGFTNDQLNVSGLTDASGNPVDIYDVTVTDTNGDGTGDAILQFPNGESITLTGVDPATLDLGTLHSMGIPCFTPGTMILTVDGEVPAEDIRVGDEVITRDHGAQKVRWVGQKHLTADELAAHPELRPIVIRKGAFGNTRRTAVSPQHGLVLKTDAGDRLIRAKHAAEFLGRKLARIDHEAEGVTYLHIMFDQHELLFADGAPSESFYPGPEALRSVGTEACAEVLTLFPELAETFACRKDPSNVYGSPVRTYLKRSEVRNIASQVGA